MSWYELLLTLHILAMATWFGSSLAITAMGFMSLKTGPEAFGTFTLPATKWASRAHPAAGVVLLLTGFAMVADANYDFELWIILAIVGLVVAMGIGGALIGKTADGIVKRLEAGSMTTEELTTDARQLLLYTRIELVIVVLVVVDMVAKPGA
jgi:hypothetical protein